MEYRKAARTDELKEGGKKLVTPGNKALLLTMVNGGYYAIDNRCTHKGGSLFEGELNGGVIKCPKHGTAFDVRNGKVIQGGKIAFIRLKVRDTRAYPVKVEGTDILVGID